MAAALSGTLVGAAIAQTVIYLLFIRAIDLYESVSLRYVVLVFDWGFTVAVAASLVFNTIFAFTLSTVASRGVTDFLTAVVGAPIIEECSKRPGLVLGFSAAYPAGRRSGVGEVAGGTGGIRYGTAG